jgi:uncharacterized protein
MTRGKLYENGEFRRNSFIFFSLSWIILLELIDKILLSLQSVSNKKITQESLLFIDEIQAAPNGIAALCYFYEEKPEIPVIAAGSLLEFALSKYNFSMPVGRIEYLYLGPMTFMEYLFEIDSTNSEILKDFDFNKPLPTIVHNTLL